MQTKGFTLIELLVVIGILAILAVAAILVLNPAQLFAEARDSQRINDMNNLKSAIALYLSTVSSPNMGFAGGTCGTNYWASVAGATNVFTVTGTQSSNVGTTIDGNGWVPVKLSDISGGSPLSALPTDPLNPDTATQNYAYSCNNVAKTFEIDAKMESTRYACGGSSDVESTDGGNRNTCDGSARFEVGNAPGLAL
jgi:prepilin-type N-terminal cleavage/methylation domain-containing protein